MPSKCGANVRFAPSIARNKSPRNNQFFVSKSHFPLIVRSLPSQLDGSIDIQKRKHLDSELIRSSDIDSLPHPPHSMARTIGETPPREYKSSC